MTPDVKLDTSLRRERRRVWIQEGVGMDYAADKARRRALGHDQVWLDDFRNRLVMAPDIQAAGELATEADEQHGLNRAHVIGYWVVARGLTSGSIAIAAAGADALLTNFGEGPDEQEGLDVPGSQLTHFYDLSEDPGGSVI